MPGPSIEIVVLVALVVVQWAENVWKLPLWQSMFSGVVKLVIVGAGPFGAVGALPPAFGPGCPLWPEVLLATGPSAWPTSVLVPALVSVLAPSVATVVLSLAVVGAWPAWAVVAVPDAEASAS